MAQPLLPSPHIHKPWMQATRDQFRKCVNKKMKTGQGAIPKKPGKYEEVMAFLHTYMQEWETVTNLSVEICSDEEENKDMSSSPILGSEIDSYLRPETIDVQKCSARGIKRRIAESVSVSLMNYILTTQPKENRINIFLSGTSASIKTLSPMQQIRAKAEIYGIVSPLERE
ncbi:uncharacterized protein LOC126355157 isoform X2 [Schistocerca gregaria]|uniref:uncharacterized protein LOC126355157 isoform X2 n=1 Tax=Schistocerca gregaria TaxID=7010 RepID=UPI00211DE278|nr:uncharacterized protein LOC126355157 isoform X2 [Schistocerca gregaria]